jgi:hypothetical protein
MADQKLTISIEGEDKISSVLRDISEKQKGFAQQMKKHWAVVATGVNQVMQLAGKLGRAFDAAFEAVERGAQSLDLKEALERKTGQPAEKMLDPLRKAVQGTVTDLDLLKNINLMQAFGIPAKESVELMEVAFKSATATGQDMKFLLDSVTSAVARQSSMRLDNIGIVVSQTEATAKAVEMFGKEADALSKTEQMMGFLTLAKEGSDKAFAHVEDMESHVAAIKKVSVAWSNAKTHAEETLALLVTGKWEEVERRMRPVTREFKKMFGFFERTINAQDLMDRFQKREIQRLKEQADAAKKAADEYRKLNDEFWQRARGLRFQIAGGGDELPELTEEQTRDRPRRRGGGGGGRAAAAAERRGIGDAPRGVGTGFGASDKAFESELELLEHNLTREHDLKVEALKRDEEIMEQWESMEDAIEEGKAARSKRRLELLDKEAQQIREFGAQVEHASSLMWEAVGPAAAAIGLKGVMKFAQGVAKAINIQAWIKMAYEFAEAKGAIARYEYWTAGLHYAAAAAYAVAGARSAVGGIAGIGGGGGGGNVSVGRGGHLFGATKRAGSASSAVTPANDNGTQPTTPKVVNIYLHGNYIGGKYATEADVGAEIINLAAQGMAVHNVKLG